jgi:hypothetical protein
MPIPKTLFVCLASYKVHDRTGSDPTNIDRQTVYAIAMDQLIRTMPAGTGVILAENTVGGLPELVPALQEQLIRPEIQKKIFLNDNTLGAKNFGAGEYVMCKRVLDDCADLVNRYDWIVYFTSRYIMPYPLIFHYLEKYAHKQAVVANATYLCSDNGVVQSAPGNYNDMIFAMKREVFVRYVESMNPEKLAKEKMNSETHLYNFIHDNQVDYQEVYRWGTLRYDYHKFQMQII